MWNHSISRAASSLAALVLLSGAVQELGATGIFRPQAPWYEILSADSSLVYLVGARYVDAEREASIFEMSMLGVRRGPVAFGGRWSYIVLRQAEETVFGFGDPQIFARVDVPTHRLGNGGYPTLFVEAMGRIPAGRGKLFPLALPKQDLALYGGLHLHELVDFHLAVGRIFQEPPGESGQTRLEVPHATHAWTYVRESLGRIEVYARADALAYEVRNVWRGIVTGALVYRDAGGFDISLEVGWESSRKEFRVFDATVRLGFSSVLRSPKTEDDGSVNNP